MVDNGELFDRYPWGRVAFDLLVDFMNRVVTKQEANKDIHGRVHFSILVWAYEVIPTLITSSNFLLHESQMKCLR